MTISKSFPKPFFEETHFQFFRLGFCIRNDCLIRYLTDFPSSRNVGQGHFIVKASYESRLMRCHTKKCLVPKCLVLRAPSHGLSITLQVLPGGRFSVTKRTWRNASYCPAGACSSGWYMASARARQLFNCFTAFKVLSVLLWWFLRC